MTHPPLEEREERAAIMEYDGGLSRADADRLAGVHERDLGKLKKDVLEGRVRLCDTSLYTQEWLGNGKENTNARNSTRRPR